MNIFIVLKCRNNSTIVDNIYSTRLGALIRAQRLANRGRARNLESNMKMTYHVIKKTINGQLTVDVSDVLIVTYSRNRSTFQELGQGSLTITNRHSKQKRLS